MRRPSFQFYPADWAGNSNLRRCSHAEKGIWVDVMCLMHDQEEYGVLRWPLKEIAQAVGCTPKALAGIVAKGVLKGSDLRLDEPFIYTPRSGRKDGEPVTLIPQQDGPIWYSSRMVKDEYVRTVRGESSRFGADQDEAPKPTPKPSPKASPKPPFGDGSSSSSSATAYSVPNGTGHSPPPDPEGIDPTKAIFDLGVSILTAAGSKPSAARSLVGKLRKEVGDDRAMAILVAAKATTDPAAYIGAAMKPDPVADEIRRKTGAEWVERLPDGRYRAGGRYYNADGSGRVALC